MPTCQVPEKHPEKDVVIGVGQILTIIGCVIFAQIIFGGIARKLTNTGSIVGWLIIFCAQVFIYSIIPIAPVIAIAGYIWAFVAGTRYSGWLLVDIFFYQNDNWWDAIAAFWGNMEKEK